MSILDRNLIREACYIGGRWITTTRTISVKNPATGQFFGKVPDCGRMEAAEGIEAARKAWDTWKKMTAVERGRIMHRWADLISAKREALATILTIEEGKPLAESLSEIDVGASYINWNAEEGRRAYGQIIPTSAHGKRPVTIRQPIGVVAAITPWNFPSSMITRKVAPALAAGCPIIVKPASETPFSAIAIAVLAEEAGIPPGVFNVITGDPEKIGAEFTWNKTIRALSFTGSTQVGKLLMRDCADTLKKVSLELGGNAPFIIFDDVDVKEAATKAVRCKFRNAGQTCICANRILIQDTIYNEFMQEFEKQVRALVVGSGLDSGTTIGPLISERAHAKMDILLQDAISKGANIICGGKPHSLGHTFYEPTILTRVTPDMRVFREEIFGPIAPVISFSTEEEAIRLANDTEYGLAGYLFTRDIGRICRVGEAMECGMVGVNDEALGISEIPFGGVKESGQGREGGKYGIEEFSEVKYLLLGGVDK